MTKKNDNSRLNAMISRLKKAVDLVDFIETEAGVNMHWRRGSSSAACACPMPWHNDGEASFFINKMEDGTYVYHCFGCEAKGTIIKFCMDYMDMKKAEAVAYLADKYGIENVTEAEILEYQLAVHTIDNERQMENANILASNQCRCLLRKNFNKHKEWVQSAYKRINKAFQEDDLFVIEGIGHEASKRMYQ